MSPQLVDFDADGQLDLVMGTFEGVAYIMPGTKDGYAEPEYILDREGRTILLSQFWNRETEKWDDADRSPAGRKNPEDHCISVVAVDWDADGDLDLLLGAKEGRLYLRFNEGKPGAPRFSGSNEPVQVEGGTLSVPGGLTAPRLVDWNGDGLFDLVCGSFDDGVYLYLNDGEPGKPRFGVAHELVSGKSGNVELPDRPQRPSSGFYVEAVDYDGDGDLDLVVGGESKWYNPERELSREEEVRVAELAKELESLETRISGALQAKPDKDDEGYPAWREGYRVLQDQSRTIKRELAPLTPGPKTGEFVWLYRRIG